MAKVYIYKDLKVLPETFKKFHKAKNLAEFKNEEKITVSDFLEGLLEHYFKKYDNTIIKKFDK